MGQSLNCACKAENRTCKEVVLWLVRFKLGVNTGFFEQSEMSGFSKRLVSPEAGDRAGKTVRP